jgi:thiamine pyrophosphokinase
MQDRVVVFASGAAPHPVADDDFVIAADAGAEAAARVDLLVGDLDSISPPTLARLEAANVPIERHAEAKDASDLELALDAALARGADRVLVAGGASGRLDQLVGLLLLLGAERYARVELDARLGHATVHVVRRRRLLKGSGGETISLFAVHGPAIGVRTRGLVYPLADETLEPGSSRGLSNAFADADASIEVAAGVLLAVRPGSA